MKAVLESKKNAAVELIEAGGGVFEIELWPGEGRPQFQAVARELPIREIPSTSATIVRRLRVSRGQRIAFDETRYRTTESGQLQVLSTTSVCCCVPSWSRS